MSRASRCRAAPVAGRCTTRASDARIRSERDSMSEGSEFSRTGSVGTRNASGLQSSRNRTGTTKRPCVRVSPRTHSSMIAACTASPVRAARRRTGDSIRFAIERNLAEDPDFMMRVGERNHLSATRMWQMSEDKQIAMAAEYLAWKAMAQNMRGPQASGANDDAIAPKLSHDFGSHRGSAAGGSPSARAHADGFHSATGADSFDSRVRHRLLIHRSGKIQPDHAQQDLRCTACARPGTQSWSACKSTRCQRAHARASRPRIGQRPRK
ncbi:IncF plasmid conjugative transfer protein TraG [Candidatus Burkholderia pumila]|uniref:IncF plasmid conjugative transfer protein TraG n=1 Tax=Candidatus Burkholderia pumila TaxID=1090375 RepID=A0ABR5HPJ1_9BURK|nr:IncF plasmid conjugative transfer protein TraG [Candidatus Burkholderia pumila]